MVGQKRYLFAVLMEVPRHVLDVRRPVRAQLRLERLWSMHVSMTCRIRLQPAYLSEENLAFLLIGEQIDENGEAIEVVYGGKVFCERPSGRLVRSGQRDLRSLAHAVSNLEIRWL